MGCGSSSETVDLPRKVKYRKDLNHISEESSDQGLLDYLGDPTDMNPHTKKGFAVSKFAKHITSAHLSSYSTRTLRLPEIPLTVRDDREIKHLAMAFGRDARGRPIQDYYLPSVKELSREDGSNESHIFRKLTEMEKDETMMSDGNLTTEPNTISCSVSYAVKSTQAKWACSEHMKDDDEMRYINRPCDPEIKIKCRIWDGAFTLGSELMNPGDPESFQKVVSIVGEDASTSTPICGAATNKKDSSSAKMDTGSSTKSQSTVQRDDWSSVEEHPFAPS